MFVNLAPNSTPNLLKRKTQKLTRNQASNSVLGDLPMKVPMMLPTFCSLHGSSMAGGCEKKHGDTGRPELYKFCLQHEGYG